MLTTHRSYATRFPSSLMRGVSGDDPEGGAGSGVLRPRLVTAGSGGPVHRPPGMTTWLRGASLHGSGGNAGDGSEARPPAENRHGGAPRGERPASWDAPRLTRADPSRLASATNEIVRLSALRPPLQGDGRDHKDDTRAQQRAAGTNNTALFDIVKFGEGTRERRRLHRSFGRWAKRTHGRYAVRPRPPALASCVPARRKEIRACDLSASPVRR